MPEFHFGDIWTIPGSMVPGEPVRLVVSADITHDETRYVITAIVNPLEMDTTVISEHLPGFGTAILPMLEWVQPDELGELKGHLHQDRHAEVTKKLRRLLGQ